MARPKMNDLDDYADHLTAQGVGATTSRTYVSHVRRVLRSVPTLSEASLTEFLYSSVSGASRSTVRTAWKYFRTFVSTTLNQTVPDFGTLSPRAVKQVEAAFNPPPDVSNALASIINLSKVTPSMLAAATWRSVSLTDSKGKPVVYLSVREGRVTGAIFPKQLLLPLLAWAAPDSTTPLKAQPLIPTEAGGNTPVTALQLRRLAARALDASKLFNVTEGLTEADEGADVFDLEIELARYEDEHGQEVEVSRVSHPRFAPLLPAPVVAPEPQSGSFNQSRFAAAADPEDRPMSTAELLNYIAQQRPT
jgi:hypothetical protein